MNNNEKQIVSATLIFHGLNMCELIEWHWPNLNVSERFSGLISTGVLKVFGNT